MLQLSWRQLVRASTAYCGIYRHRTPVEFCIIEGRGGGFKSSRRASVSTGHLNIKTTTLSLKKRRPPPGSLVSSLEMFNSDDNGFSGCCGGVRRKLKWVWLENALSTMDEARVRIQDQNENDQNQSQPPIIAVATSNQTAGRGTSNRAWYGSPGNAFLTVGIPRNEIPISLTLTPLRVGTLIAPLIAERIPVGMPVELKWPNDVLIDGEKVAGVLIETVSKNGMDWLLIGIGINSATAPKVPVKGLNKGRSSTCMAIHNSGRSGDGVRVQNAAAPKEIAHELTRRLKDWVTNANDSDASVYADWSKWADWTRPVRIRDDSGLEAIPLRLEPDGSLRVRLLSTGDEKILVAEYLE